MYILRPHAVGILYAPPFYISSTPRRVFSGVGGVGVYKIWPRKLVSAILVCELCISGKKKEPKSKLLGPDVLRWGGGLPREGVGAEKFGMSLETRETKLFWRDVPGFCRDIPEVPEKFETKSLCSMFVP